ncbi:AI-2E family transporter [bacterium]|nr:AI-2E family transporter [bacterium]
MNQIISFVKQNKTYFVIGFIFIIIYLLRAVLTPILTAFFLAYLIDPAVTFLERFRLPRAVGITVLVFLFSTFSLVFLFVLIPELLHQIKILSGHIPAIHQKISSLLASTGLTSEAEISKHTESFLNSMKDNLPELLNMVLKMALKAITKTKGLLGVVVNIIMIPLFLFYFLRDFKKVTERIESFIPQKEETRWQNELKRVDSVLKSYFSGQLIVVLFLATSYSIGLAITGIPLSFVIGILAGVLSIIPYFGATIGIIVAMGMAILNIPTLGVWGIIGVALTFLVSNTIEGFFITPKVMSEKVGISPFFVILALFIGGGVFGLLGMLFAVPVAAVLKNYFVEWERNYKQSDFFKN